MYILGWDIEFGHLEAVNLISSQVYSEKQIVSEKASFTIGRQRLSSHVCRLLSGLLGGYFALS